jgi:type I restriction enzyme M protein
MLDQHKKNEINIAILKMFSAFQGRLDIADCTILVMAILALKYIADTKIEEPAEDGFTIQPRYQVPLKANFYELHFNRNLPGNGARLDEAVRLLETCDNDLKGMFLGVSFNSPRLGSEYQKQQVLGRLIEAAFTPALNFYSNRGDRSDVSAFAAEAVLNYDAEASGKRSGEHFTPYGMSSLVARLMQPKTGEKIYDPFCGTASTLIVCNQLVREQNDGSDCYLFGQEMNGTTIGLAKMNLLLHGESCQLAWGDTLQSPDLFDSDILGPYCIVVSHPPFSLREWGFEWASYDSLGRFRHGIPPKASGDFACISHMLASLHPDKGRMAVIVSLGVLFRGGAEGQIRQSLIEEDLIDAVIALPPKLLTNTSIPTAILILRKRKIDDSILFIDASSGYLQGKAVNALRETDLDRIVETYKARESIDQYSKRASKAEVAANDYNLSVTRYVEILEEEQKIDLSVLRAERDRLKAELQNLEARLAKLLEDVSRA